MATVQELKDKVSSAEFNLNFRKGGNQNSRRGPDGLMPLGGIDYLLQRNISRQEKFKADGNLDALENEQRIYSNLISERLEQERVIARREIELAALKQELEVAVSNQAQQDAAKGQTAAAPTANGEAAPLVVPVTNEQQTKLDQSKTGELSSKVEQSQDPVAANKQNAQAGTGQAKSEANFSGEKTTDGAASVSGTSEVSGDSKLRPAKGVALQNKLDFYSSYTYRITLFLLTKNDYNNLAASTTKFVPTFSLISSGAGFAKPGSIKTETTRKTTPGGGYEDITTTQTRAGRHPDFQTDFYIDDLKLMTSVGLNAKSKAANITEITFTITEPYGLSLLDRLLSASETCGDNNPNYMEQPYLLQIDLLASPTDGVAEQQKTTVIDTKRVAIKLAEMKISPSGSGSTYAIRAIPYNHTAFSLSTAAMPVSMSVEAGTVNEFFSNSNDLVKLFTKQSAEEDERIENEVKAWLKTKLPGAYQPSAEEIATYRQTLINAIKYNSKSLAAGYNGYMDKVTKDQKLSKLPPTKIAFSILDDNIGKSPIVNDTAQTTDGRMTARSNTVGKADPKTKSTQIFNLNAGTSIIDIIDMVMSKSKYIKDQIVTTGKTNNDKNENKANRADKDSDTKLPLNWYKIIPTVVLNDFDSVRNTYSKTILYTILPYKTPNSYHPNFPQSTAQNNENKIVREYNYFYTGQNKDILRLDIDFDSSFYTQITSKPGQVARLGSDRNSDATNTQQELDQFSLLTQSAAKANQKTNPPIRYEISGTNRQNTSMNGANDPDEQIVGDLKQSLYTKQRGDALNIKLEIIGDPDFIKQDDIYYNPGNPAEYLDYMNERLPNSAAPINKSGQILFDAEQVFVKVAFKNAVDINDKIGIVNKQEILTNGRRTDGSFSGIYRVLRVENHFNRGQFTQILDLVRMIDSIPSKNVEAPNTQSVPQSAKNSEELDQSKRSAFAANPAGVVTPVSPALQIAANQPALPGGI